ncbi:MAG TPA: serine hydrolase domain-containing protein [Methylomirabilota bacterium]|nr:serine hydrolase domain-containing protein [Methylomirabilota bacterium]
MRYAIVLLGSLLIPVLAWAQPTALPPPVADRVRLFEAWIESQMAYRGQPGLALGIVHDQDLVWAKGFGFADRERGVPATPETLFRVASITKTFTTTAVMQLRDQGKLQLDDPVTKHLPSFAVRPREPGGQPITIRHLLTHVSGLPREADLPYWMNDRFPTREEMLKGLANHEQFFNVETRWKYSNLAMALAGEIVTTVAGEPWERYVKRRILDPLGMTATLTDAPDEPVTNLATAYGRRFPDLTRPPRSSGQRTAGLAPAAGMASNVRDLAKYVALQFRSGPEGGAQVLSGSSLREMQRVHWLNPDWQGGQGLGFAVRRVGERTLVGHGGWLPGMRSQITFDVRDKVGVVVLSNADDGNPGLYVDQAFTLVAPALARKPAAPAVAAPPGSWAMYEGLYRSPWGDSQVVLLSTGLVIFDPSGLSNPERLLRLRPQGEHTFRAEGGFWDGGRDGEPVLFEIGGDGRVARLKVGPNYATPVR